MDLAAAFVENPLVVKALLDAGADVGVRDFDGWTPMHAAAAFNENPLVVKALLDAGADVGARIGISRTGSYHTHRADDNTHRFNRPGNDSEYGWTPLHSAAAYNENPLVVQALLDAGSDLRSRSERDWTPLHSAAASNNNPLVVQALLDAGADGNVRTLQGILPFELASDNPRIKDSQAYWQLNDLSYD